MKVTVIGGGSTYTPELVSGFLQRLDSLPLTELWLMDIDQQRLNVVGKFIQRMCTTSHAPFHVNLTQDRAVAIRDADYVITQLRVGQMPARRADEYLCHRHHLIGQETTGIGGMAKALRTIPVILDIARDIQTFAPHALLLNFTNPSGLVTEALFRYAPKVQAVGVCNSALTTKMSLVEEYNKLVGKKVDPQEAQLDVLGINHLTWYRGLKINHNEVWNELFPYLIKQSRSESEPEWDVPLLESLRLLPNSYLQYYYYTQHKLELQQDWPPSRAEQVMKIEAELLTQYAEPDRTIPPPGLMERGGAYYSTVATQLINAHFNDLKEIHIVNTKQGNAVPGYPSDWVMELPCIIDRNGIHPLPAKPLPQVCYSLIQQIKTYELLTVEAAVHGDRSAAYQAMLAHPLGPDADQIPVVLDDLIETHGSYLPEFIH
jgi:6-phospho-beta-glucosidase